MNMDCTQLYDNLMQHEEFRRERKVIKYLSKGREKIRKLLCRGYSHEKIKKITGFSSDIYWTMADTDDKNYNRLLELTSKISDEDLRDIKEFVKRTE